MYSNPCLLFSAFKKNKANVFILCQWHSAVTKKNLYKKWRICSGEVVRTGWAKWFWVQSQPGLLNVPHVLRALWTNQEHALMVGWWQFKSNNCLSVWVCKWPLCVCPVHPGLTLWLLGWVSPFFCLRKWKVRNSILYWFTEMWLLTLTYYYWPYSLHLPKGGLLLHIFINQLNVWFSLSGSTGFLPQTTDMCLQWIGDSKLTSGVNVSVNACSPCWPCD